MKNETGKITIASVLAVIIISYVGYCAFILISNKVKSDSTQKEVVEAILRLKADETITAKATERIISTLEAKGYTLDSEDKRSIEVFHDKQRRIIEFYYSYQYEMDFLLFKYIKYINVEDSRSTERWN